MKNLSLVLLVAMVSLVPVMAEGLPELKQESTFQRIAVFPFAGASLASGDVGGDLGIQGLFDFDNPGKAVNLFAGARLFMGATNAAAYDDTDIYGSLAFGFRYRPFAKKNNNSSNLALRLGIDLGGGSTSHDTGSVTWYHSWLWEPSLKLEFPIDKAVFVVSSGYRGIVSPIGGWSFKKNLVPLSLGIFVKN